MGIWLVGQHTIGYLKLYTKLKSQSILTKYIQNYLNWRKNMKQEVLKNRFAILFKRIITTTLLLMLALPASLGVMASEVSGFNKIERLYAGESIQLNDSTLQFIEFSDLPEGIIPIPADSLDEALEIINQIELSFSELNFEFYASDSLAKSRSMHATLNTQIMSMGLFLDLNAWISFSDGRFTNVEPYSSLRGFSLGFSWTQNSTHVNFSNNNRRFDAFATGTSNIYLVVQGEILLSSSTRTLNGYGTIDFFRN